MLTPLTDDDPTAIGPYRLQNRIGEGGMGTVYLAFTERREPVAVKVASAELAEDVEFRRRFQREVRAAQRVRGGAVAAVLDADTQSERPWMVTEYVEGISLADAVRQRGPLTERLVRGLAAGLADALVAIHEAGVVHRDLKPSNILLAWDGPRVIDFGIAQLDGNATLTRTGHVVGTLAWMAPEQMRGEQAGPPADIFSWGCCVAYAATGRHPFHADRAEVLAFRIQREGPDLDHLPDYLLATVIPALEKEPGLRPSAAGLLANLSGHPVRTMSEAHRATETVLERDWTGQLPGRPARRPDPDPRLAARHDGALPAPAGPISRPVPATWRPDPAPAPGARPAAAALGQPRPGDIPPAGRRPDAPRQTGAYPLGQRLPDGYPSGPPSVQPPRQPWPGGYPAGPARAEPPRPWPPRQADAPDQYPRPAQYPRPDQYPRPAQDPDWRSARAGSLGVPPPADAYRPAPPPPESYRPDPAGSGYRPVPPVAPYRPALPPPDSYRPAVPPPDPHRPMPPAGGGYRPALPAGGGYRPALPPAGSDVSGPGTPYPPPAGAPADPRRPQPAAAGRPSGDAAAGRGPGRGDELADGGRPAPTGVAAAWNVPAVLSAVLSVCWLFGLGSVAGVYLGYRARLAARSAARRADRLAAVGIMLGWPGIILAMIFLGVAAGRG
ncbi:serine/threonine-protein kinase [Pseudofrankia inefficax]|uniref:Serine/threonine protein kinase n=1 Tax=Pseudofrankia inefficax (strain DSM 45817 / CECT 9037 / DDB 130130 / EuI1c) TaxID=298654 RepID=E3J241_PSEI1|nr:serine/threonine-protein kinase [Pseudofrankia inefficax]ADP84146.1 serine/threonine protein kinase [Pseudofrankia inefficax]